MVIVDEEGAPVVVVGHEAGAVAVVVGAAVPGTRIGAAVVVVVVIAPAGSVRTG